MEINIGEADDYIWILKVRYNAAMRRVRAFENGHAYQLLLDYANRAAREKDIAIRKAKREAASYRNETISVRRAWSQILDDADKEHHKEIKALKAEIIKRDQRIFDAECQRDRAKDEAKEWRYKYYDLANEIEKLQGENEKLKAQVNKDFENSSIPSSQQGARRKKIPNSRVKTNRSRGGQIGHEGHRLQQRKPTESHMVPDPEEYTQDSDYYFTGEILKRQKIVLSVDVNVIEYMAKVFRNRKTGSCVHADFPPGYDTDISYDSSVKAFAFLLANEGNMSAGKIRTVLREASHGKLDISEATINGMCKEFSEKSKPEQDEILKGIMTSPVVNTDFTNANVNGDSKQVLIAASPITDAALFISRDAKGHKGIIGTPIEKYVGILVHDHDVTFYNYGLIHQECLQHILRYLVGSTQNEPHLKWNGQMHSLLQEMLHYKNGVGSNDFDPDIVSEFENRYDEILEIAHTEYENEPPSDYYREGYNLYRRLVKYKDSVLLFLHDKRVPSNNSLAERLARTHKRKQRQAIVFRSKDNHSYLCDCLSVIKTYRQRDENLYDTIEDIFSRQNPNLKTKRIKRKSCG